MADEKVIVIETDVLVIGGGLAGCMAAIKAADQDGLRVTLVDKSNTVRGVNIINRVQMTDLISTEGQISGAVGIGTRTADVYLFKAKAIVLSAGRSNRLSRNPTGFDFNTRIPSPMSGDGTSMAIFWRRETGRMRQL